jgi:hypothetical protein
MGENCSKLQNFDQTWGKLFKLLKSIKTWSNLQKIKTCLFKNTKKLFETTKIHSNLVIIANAISKIPKINQNLVIVSNNNSKQSKLGECAKQSKQRGIVNQTFNKSKLGEIDEKFPKFYQNCQIS